MDAELSPNSWESCQITSSVHFQLICELSWRCERSKENIPRHAIWKHGQWQDRGQERTSRDLSEGGSMLCHFEIALLPRVCLFSALTKHLSPSIFLQQLCAIPEIANSEEMQEFLALNTDARIAFVKKPFIVSRIDKVFFPWNSVFSSRGLRMDQLYEGNASFWYIYFFDVQIVVNAIVDTLKTAFPRSEPQSPTEDNDAEVDGGKISTDKKSRCVCRDPIILLTNQTNKNSNQTPCVYLWRSFAFFDSAHTFVVQINMFTWSRCTKRELLPAKIASITVWDKSAKWHCGTKGFLFTNQHLSELRLFNFYESSGTSCLGLGWSSPRKTSPSWTARTSGHRFCSFASKQAQYVDRMTTQISFTCQLVC